MKRLDAHAIAREIEALLSAYPELAEDDVLRADMVEAETDAATVVGLLLDRLQHAAAMQDALTARIRDMQARRDRYGRQQDAMRAGIFQIMQAAGLSKMELAEATLSIRPAGPRVVITDETELPIEFLRLKAEPDKAAIKDALKAGEFVPGASLSNGTDVLNVRVA